jgi:hypothetical protein
MGLGLTDERVVDRVALLAEEYAALIVAALPSAESEEMLRQGLAGSFLSFLKDALLVANSGRAQ